MEVHHPHHLTHKKKWTEYLLEFFMLFLAVFLGFVAENIRENYVERHREKEYIYSLKQDLQANIDILQNQIPQLRPTVTGLDTLIKQIYLYLEGKADTRLLYYNYHHYCRIAISLQLSERTVNQLKNSGNMRLIKNKTASDIISNLDVGFQEFRDVTAFLRTRQEDAANSGLKIFDISEYKKANSINGILHEKEEGFLKITYQPLLNLNDPLYLKEFAARVGYYRNFLNVYINGLESAIPKFKSSIDSLEHEYNLK